MTPGIFPSTRRFRLISFPVYWRRSAVHSIIAIFSLLLYEQRADRILEMDPLDGLAQQGRNREDVKLPARRLGPQGDRVVFPLLRLYVLEHHRRRVKGVHRNVEESLDLSRVKVHRQQPGDARRG